MDLKELIKSRKSPPFKSIDEDLEKLPEPLIIWMGSKYYTNEIQSRLFSFSIKYTGTQVSKTGLYV